MISSFAESHHSELLNLFEKTFRVDKLFYNQPNNLLNNKRITNMKTKILFYAFAFFWHCLSHLFVQHKNKTQQKQKQVPSLLKMFNK